MKGNPFDGDVPPSVVARMMKDSNRLASILQKELPGWEASPAQLFADIVNVQRADVKQTADALGVVDDDGQPLEMNLMREQDAADMIAGLTDGNMMDLVLVFNELARKRNLILLELLGNGAEYEQFMDNKTSVMHTDDPETWRDEDDDVDEEGDDE